MNTDSKEASNKIITIPNILTVFRLLLIPVMVWCYCIKGEYLWTMAVIMLSGFTDVTDGYIARKFNMVSNLGKALDPIADKLTQGIMLFCLITKFPNILLLFGLLVVKEILNGTLNLIVMKKTGKVYGADLHGKINTCLLYAIMVLHVIWGNIPAYLSNCLIIICMCMMIISMFIYTVTNFKRIKENNLESF
ncbi:MAG: CDP-alcohol phosphatidyltransferase family protein [Agathobacter sp.]|nr:CDP-alcohol phosphatidyltransferase family protein [Agathobacter sp.]